MTDPIPSPDRTDPPAYPGAPRWVKVLGLLVAAPVLLFIMLELVGVDIEHGPGSGMQHGSAGAPLSSPEAPVEADE